MTTTTTTTEEESESGGSGGGGGGHGEREEERGSNGLLLPIGIPPNSSGGIAIGGGAGRPISLYSSFFSTTPSDPPPIYGEEDSHPQNAPLPDPTLTQTPFSSSRDPTRLASSFSPELARFASAHRDVINENLEARLQAAGYLPTDDPSRLTAEEWRVEYGITKLELRRLLDLHTQ